MNSKLKNKGLWVSFAALIPLVLKSFNIDILPGNYSEIVNAILSFLVAAGILSNPSLGTGYVDTTTQPTNATESAKVITAADK